MNNRNIALDLAKILAMLLVAYGHLVSVATFAVDIPGVFPKQLSSPITPMTLQSFWKIESFFSNLFGIQFGVVGVIVFFFISGFLLEKSINKNKKLDLFIFIKYKFSKIFFTLLLSTFFVSCFNWCFNSINLNINVFCYTLTGIPFLFGSNSILVSIWFLSVLIFSWFFYFLFLNKNIIQLYLILFVIVILPYPLKDTDYYNIFYALAFYARMSGVILVGITYGIVSNLNYALRLCYLLIAFILSLLLLKLFQNLYNFYETYANIYSFIFAVIILLICLFIQRYVYNINIIVKLINALSKIFLPFYLIHVTVGLNFLVLFNKIFSYYISLSLSFCACFIISYFIVYLEKFIKNVYFILLKSLILNK